jgi:hypothetical protein
MPFRWFRRAPAPTEENTLLCGGKYRVPWDRYHAIPEGWDAPSLEKLHRRLGGEHSILPRPLWLQDSDWSTYRASLYLIADGVRDRCAPCGELAVRYIELRYIGSYSGFVRSLLARRLKHGELTLEQRRRLSAHFLHMLTTGDRCDEFRDYVSLWYWAITPEDLQSVRTLAAENNFARRVLARVTPSTLRPSGP